MEDKPGALELIRCPSPLSQPSRAHCQNWCFQRSQCSSVMMLTLPGKLSECQKDVG